MQPFNLRLRELRRRAGLTQEQFAHACGKSGQSYTSNYEQGSREPSISELPLIAKVLGVTIPELFTDTEKNSAPNRDLQPLPVRLDPATLSTAYKVALGFAKIRLGLSDRKEFNPAKSKHAELLAEAYAVVSGGGLPSRDISSALEGVTRRSAKTSGGSHGKATAPAKRARKRS